MSDISILRARLRPRDKDILQAVKRLKLEEGEMADIIRDGTRLRLIEMGVMGTKDARKAVQPITTDPDQLKEIFQLLSARR